MGASRSNASAARPAKRARTDDVPPPRAASSSSSPSGAQASNSLPPELPPLPFAPVQWQSSSSAVPQVASSFASLVSLIPPEFYLLRSDFPSVPARHSPAPRLQAPTPKHSAKSARIAKLDPSNHPSAAQVAAARVAAQAASWPAHSREPSASELPDEREGESENESLRFVPDDDDEATMHNGDDTYVRKRKRSADDDASTATTEATVRAPAPAPAPAPTPAPPKDATIGDLRARLQARIAALRATRRGVPDEPVGGSDESTTGSVADLLAERRRRGEMRDRRRRERKEARRAAALTAAAAAAASSPSPSLASLASRASPALSARSPPIESAFKHPALWTPVPAATPSMARERDAFSPCYQVELSIPDGEQLGTNQAGKQISPSAAPMSAPQKPTTSASASAAAGLDGPSKPANKIEKKEGKPSEAKMDGHAPSSTPSQSVSALLPPAPPSSSDAGGKHSIPTNTDRGKAAPPEAPRKDRPKGKGKLWAERGKPPDGPHSWPNKHGRKLSPHDFNRPGSAGRSLPGKAKAARPGFEGRASALRARAMVRKGKKGK